ncbi:MAG: RNase adapter RapZ [Deltaproteobacteria bacterium]|nr:RNase adapter RapZ [Deltaproteobacteria bacterium]
MNPLRIVVVTGMSGSGKTTAAHALEDAGFFCIDNLPPALIGRLTDLLVQSGGEVARVALVVDVREGIYLKDLPATIDGLRTEGCRVEVVFLDSGDDTLARRFKETRRRHPLSTKGTVEDGISEERTLLKPLRGMSDRVIDTSGMTVHDLRKVVEEFVGDPAGTGAMSVAVISFGFRYGLPLQSDLVFDARFLPNPFYVPKFKGMKGNEPAVAEFVLSNADGREFVARVMDLLGFLIPRFRAEGKVYLNVGIGCTGGLHRSVAIAEELARRLAASGVAAVCRHRDVDRS